MGEVPMYILAGGLMIGVLVIVHEAGHYVVARLFGVGTPVFSIGMGPRIFGFRFWETDFRISLLPIGGYVRMAGADAFGEEDAEGWEHPDEDFMSKPVWQRLLIMLAGPAANLILPFILFTGLYMAGRPLPDAHVGRVLPGSVAEEAGFQEGDRLVAVQSEPVDNWLEYQRALVTHAGESVAISVERSGQSVAVVLPENVVPEEQQDIYTALGLGHQSLSTSIGITDPKGPAYQSGLRTGDLIETVDGDEVLTFRALQQALTPGQAHELVVQRLEPAEKKGEDPVQREVKLTLQPNPEWSPPFTEVHANVWGIIPVEVFVANVQEDSAAEQAGVQRGDRLFAIDGERLRSWEDILRLVAVTADDLDLEQVAVQSRGCFSAEPTLYGRSLSLEVIRAGELKKLEFKPKIRRLVLGGEVTFRPIMGVEPYQPMKVRGNLEPAFYGAVQAVPLAVDEGVSLITQTLEALGNLITGELRPDEGLGGPVAIVRSAGLAAKAGWHRFVLMMGAISFSLGIINLLPVPVLDGGQILFYTIEGIRGRPVPLAIRERVQMIGVLFLAALMVMVVVNDIGNWLFPAG